MTFEAWFAKVDSLVEGRIGLGCSDVEDQPYRDWFEDGYSPSEAADEVVENVAGEYGF